MATDEQFERVIRAIEKLSVSSWSTSDTIASFAVGVSLASIYAAWRISQSQQSSERRRYTAQLHDWYWSGEIRGIRQTTDAAQSEWKTAPDQFAYINALLAKDKHGKSSPEWLAVSRLLFFFADLERLIRNNTVDEELALEMFGRAQYKWFEDFFAAVRKEIEKRYKGQDNPPSWICQTKRFERRLKNL